MSIVKNSRQTNKLQTPFMYVERNRICAVRGFVHYHHLVRVSDGKLHPSKVLWLKHVATSSFTLDGGPHPELAHEVSPGVDYEFVPNWDTPYDPGMHHNH